MLLAHRALNPQTGKEECPWWVLDRNDMKNGLEGVCLPGELYHTYYVDVDKEQTVIWPDLIILAKNGWQIPVYNGQIPNVGIKAPTWSPPWRVYNGGHGSVDTLAYRCCDFNSRREDRYTGQTHSHCRPGCYSRRFVRFRAEEHHYREGFEQRPNLNAIFKAETNSICCKTKT